MTNARQFQNWSSANQKVILGLSKMSFHTPFTYKVTDTQKKLRFPYKPRISLQEC